MTTLEAVNEIIEAIGEPRATALDTGGTSDVADAERVLDRESRRVQGERWWHTNPYRKFALDVPDIRMTYTGTDPVYTYNEVVTQQTSGAYGRFAYTDTTNDYVYLIKNTNSPAFTNSALNLVGATSAVTKAGVAFSAVPDVRMAYTGADPVYTADETVTQESTGATGTFVYRDATNNYIYIKKTAGGERFTDAVLDLTGATSGTVKEGDAFVSYDVPRLAVPSSWLHVRPYDGESKKFAVINGFLWDMTTEGSETFVYSATVNVNAVVLQTFTELPDKLAQFIVAASAIRFQRWKKRGAFEDRYLQEQFIRAKVEAERWNAESRGTNLLETPGAIRVKGDRQRHSFVST